MYRTKFDTEGTHIKIAITYLSISICFAVATMNNANTVERIILVIINTSLKFMV